MQSTIATPTEPDLDEDSLTEEEVFKLLSNSRRRYVIHALKNRQAPVGMVELSIQVTAWERDLDPLAVKYEHRRNVYSTLQRTHIPKLEQAGIVTVDEETNSVAPTPVLADLEVYVEVLESREIPWSLYYLGLAGVGLALLVAIAVGTNSVVAVDPLHAWLVITACFGGSSLVHYVLGRRTRLGIKETPPTARRQ